MSKPVFEYEFQVKEHHLDTFGHMNHATYLQVFEEARWDIVASRGYDIYKIQKTKIGPTILRVEIDYKREILNRQKIKIVTCPSLMQKKIGYINQKMINENDKVCSEINLTYGMFDTVNRKLIEPPQDWLDALELHLKNSN